MKALALTQPWASLIACGAKRIETRSWGTDYRGPLAIYAAKNLAPIGGESALPTFCYQEPFREALFGDVWPPPNRIFELIPRGAIVCTCRLVDVEMTERLLYWTNDGERVLIEECGAEQERRFGDYTEGRVGWILTDVRSFPPVEIPKGAVRDYRGLFDVPDYLIP